MKSVLRDDCVLNFYISHVIIYMETSYEKSSIK